MARGRIFSSRRMFSTRRSSFAEPSKQSGPMGVMIGLTAAAIIIFVIGVLVGRSMPHSVASPFAVGEPVAPFSAGADDAPAVLAAPDDLVPDVAAPDAAEAAPPQAVTPDAPDASGAVTADPLSNSPLSEPVTATEH
tara:strand:- start:24 stop:434 length:411 start_codon:yes stop_codon:yes gene_type:complete